LKAFLNAMGRHDLKAFVNATGWHDLQESVMNEIVLLILCNQWIFLLKDLGQWDWYFSHIRVVWLQFSGFNCERLAKCNWKNLTSHTVGLFGSSSLGLIGKGWQNATGETLHSGWFLFKLSTYYTIYRSLQQLLFTCIFCIRIPWLMLFYV